MIPFLPAYQTKPKPKYVGCPIGTTGYYDLLDPDTGNVVQSNVNPHMPPYYDMQIPLLNASNPLCTKYRPVPGGYQGSGEDLSGGALFRVIKISGVAIFLGYVLFRAFKK